MANRIIYILADNRSGSTLLDQLLGAHSQIRSLGEVHQLPAYATRDRALYDPVHELRCVCGERIDTCRFWSAVRARLDRPFESLRLKPRLFDRRHHRLSPQRYLKRLLEHRINAEPRLVTLPLYRRILDGARLGRDSFDLFDAVFDVDTTPYLVDSSKSAIRMRYLVEHAPDRVRIVMLGRDYRGVVHSKMKRGQHLEQSASTWTARMRQMKALTAQIDAGSIVRVRYEDLCGQPTAQLTQICTFLDIEFEADMLSRPGKDVHHLGGSPSKFDPARREIRLDNAYQSAFTDTQLALMRRIVGTVADEWGY